MNPGRLGSLRRRLHHLSGQPGPVLCHSHSTELFPSILMDLPVFQFVPAALVLSLGTTGRSLIGFLYTESKDIKAKWMAAAEG